MPVVRLVDRNPRLDRDALARRFVPPRRFADVRFETYRPDPDHPSQAAALAAVEHFAAGLIEDSRPGPRWARWRRPSVASRPGRYIDGGFGVGKTHLLASLWHAAPDPRAYLTFAELAAAVGHLGMKQAVATFSGHRLICIDEFELDDVASTLMVVSLLRGLIAAGVSLAATSNTLPDRLGEGRFAADDFTREISAIAGHFDVVRVDGPDFRASQRSFDAEPLSEAELVVAVETVSVAGDTVARDALPELLAHLRTVPLVQVGALLDGVDAVAIEGMIPIASQDEALLFVHLIDELYDAEVPVVASGARVEELFATAYRNGGYRKKYGRCESRLASLLSEAARLPG